MRDEGQRESDCQRRFERHPEDFGEQTRRPDIDAGDDPAGDNEAKALGAQLGPGPIASRDLDAVAQPPGFPLVLAPRLPCLDLLS